MEIPKERMAKPLMGEDIDALLEWFNRGPVSWHYTHDFQGRRIRHDTYADGRVESHVVWDTAWFGGGREGNGDIGK